VSESISSELSMQAKILSRSMGVKLIVVCALALVMCIPAFFVEGLVQERTQRAGQVLHEISGYVGGQQSFLGPTLAVPFTVKNKDWHGVYLVFPTKASGATKTTAEERRRSLFKVPVFRADLNFDGTFDLTGVPAAAPQGAELDWNRAEVVIGVSDARGAQSDATLTMDGKTMVLVPSGVSDSMSFSGAQDQRLRLSLLGTPVAARPGMQFSVSTQLRFSGAQRIAVLAYGKTTQLKVEGDWPSPGFDGGFLPVNRSISPHGFTAEWSVPFIARGVRAEGPADSINGLDETSLGVSFIEVTDPYQSVDRSLKYVLLFLGLVFLSYFVFEVTTGKQVHAAQYVLVGIAQIIFYLLLLSLAERLGFDFGFLIAGAATVLLLSLNAAWIFASRVQAARALVVFSLLYGLIYMLLRLEDNALLVGAIASFMAVSAAMYFTRRIDWFSSLPISQGANRSA